MATYLALAYWHGWTNARHYVVAAGPEFDSIKGAAERECADRCGKYGVVVLEVTNDTDASVVQKAYFASIYGESAPADNPRIAVFQRLGQKAVLAVEQGTALMPAPQDPSLLQDQPVDVPQWLRDEKRRIEEFETATRRLTRAAGVDSRGASD